jgi:hypothetical protein
MAVAGCPHRKPLTLSRVADFDIRIIVVTSTDTVSMDQAGDVTCGADPVDLRPTGISQLSCRFQQQRRQHRSSAGVLVGNADTRP